VIVDDEPPVMVDDEPPVIVEPPPLLRGGGAQVVGGPEGCGGGAGGVTTGFITGTEPGATFAGITLVPVAVPMTALVAVFGTVKNSLMKASVSDCRRSGDSWE
jgi:hypothetical protein